MASVPADVGSPKRAPWHTVLRWFGVLCLMGAAYFAGYVAWLLWGTGLQTQQAQQGFQPTVGQWIAHPDPVPAIGSEPRILPGDAYAVILIPKIDLDMVVVQGTDYEDLKKGPGHYTDTANPWDGTGRVGIAGHRTTYLHPFFNLDKVQAGDTISLITRYGQFDYVVTANFVRPEATAGVVLEQTPDPTLVLTTCNPKYASSQRLIVTAKLVRAPPAAAK
jgi:LPXTG-site transpeptidase (sortase) family protein